MALEDLIAQAGPQLYETMRKGWLPTIGEKQARRRADLQAERQQQLIAAESQRKRLADLQLKTAESEYNYLPTKRKRAERKDELQIKTTEQAQQLFDEKMKKYKNEEQLQSEQRSLDTTSKYIKGAFNRFEQTKDIYEAKKVIRQNYDEIIEAGDDGTDKAVDRFLSSTISEDEAISMLSNLNAVLPSVQDAIDKRSLQLIKTRGSTNSAIAERYAARIAAGETLTKEEMNHYQKLTNTTPTKSAELSLNYKEGHNKEKALIKLRDTFTKSMKRITDRNATINEALQSMEAGNNALSDKLLTSKLLNLSDTNVRAIAIYKELDSSFGNLFERATDIVGRIAFGKRTARQNEIIKETLLKMKALSEPVMEKMRQNNRAIAKADGHDPFRVVPPVSAADIRDSKLIDREAKLKLFEQYPRFMDEIQ